jgi:hypothetical protein
MAVVDPHRPDTGTDFAAGCACGAVLVLAAVTLACFEMVYRWAFGG